MKPAVMFKSCPACWVLLVASLLLFVARPASAETEVDVHNVADYIGQEVVFTGVVELARRIESGTQFLDFGGRHPSALFTAVAMASKADVVGDLTVFEGKTVRVRGVVEEFNGKPQIILKAPDQIEVVQENLGSQPSSE